MNLLKLSLLLLALSGITAINALSIKNTTGYSIVVRIKDNHGMIVEGPLQIGEYGYYDVGDLFEKSRNFPYTVRVWFAKYFVDPENREYSHLLEWTPSDQMIHDEASIYALKNQGQRVNNNTLSIGYNATRGFGLNPIRSTRFNYGRLQSPKTEYANLPSSPWIIGKPRERTPQGATSSSAFVSSPSSQPEYRGSIGKQERTEYANMPIGKQRGSEYMHTPQGLTGSSEYVRSPSYIRANRAYIGIHRMQHKARSPKGVKSKSEQVSSPSK